MEQFHHRLKLKFLWEGHGHALMQGINQHRVISLNHCKSNPFPYSLGLIFWDQILFHSSSSTLDVLCSSPRRLPELTENLQVFLGTNKFESTHFCPALNYHVRPGTSKFFHVSSQPRVRFRLSTLLFDHFPIIHLDHFPIIHRNEEPTPSFIGTVRRSTYDGELVSFQWRSIISSLDIASFHRNHIVLIKKIWSKYDVAIRRLVVRYQLSALNSQITIDSISNSIIGPTSSIQYFCNHNLNIWTNEIKINVKGE